MPSAQVVWNWSGQFYIKPCASEWDDVTQRGCRRAVHDCKSMRTISGEDSFLLRPPDEDHQGLIRLHRSPSLSYLSPGMAHSQRGPRSRTPAPGPRQALQSCLLKKTDFNPPQQLSQIKSQRGEAEAHRAAGADCRADAASAGRMTTLTGKKSGVEDSDCVTRHCKGPTDLVVMT